METWYAAPIYGKRKNWKGLSKKTKGYPKRPCGLNKARTDENFLILVVALYDEFI